jgi:antitoxin VapB
MATRKRIPAMTTPETAKLFRNGRSQAVRLPARFRFAGSEVYIRQVGDAVVLTPKPAGWDDFFAGSSRLPEDFLADRGDAPPQARRRLP